MLSLNQFKKESRFIQNEKQALLHKISIFSIIILSLLILAPTNSSAQIEEAELTIDIVEVGSSQTPAAWIRVQTSENDNIGGWYKKGLKGFPIFSSTKIKVPYGPVTVTAWNSNSNEVSKEIIVTKDKPANCKLKLKPRFNMKKLGYASIEGHDHMDGDREKNLPPYIYPYCAAMGIDYLSVIQLWFHTLENPISYDSIINYLKINSTPRLHLTFGSESPKLRYGHTWTVNHPGLSDPLVNYLSWHDVDYFESQVATDSNRFTVKDLRGKLHPKWEPPFVDRLRNQSKGAFSVAAHPTRWWHHGENEVFPGTNLSADIAFDLIAAQSYDGLGVIGDFKDHIYYQNLWFNILNLGYRLTPVTESDGDVASGRLANRSLTYVWTGKNEFDINSLTQNLKAGHTTLSGKAVMLLTVDEKLPPGPVLLADGKKHTINVEVYSEPDSDEYVSYLVLYRNGKIFEKRDFRKNKKRYIKTKFKIAENETAWYVVKSYGKVYPKEALQFDVMAYAERSLYDFNDDYKHNTGVSITAPIYFNGPGWTPPKPMISHIAGEVMDKNGNPLKNLIVEIWNVDHKLANVITDDKGSFVIDAPATIDIRFTLPDGQKEQQWLFYEYPPLLDLIEDTYTIAWAKEYLGLQGGQVPWKAFHYNEIKEVLKNINWTIIPNGKIMLTDVVK
ncbi:MAG: hypothetical protein ABI208_00650 [Ginsengibacter sp.]